VREQFAKFITAHRRQVKCENVILVVVTDADEKDEHAYEDRLNTLTNTLTEPLSKAEKIVVLIPAKNIETWFRTAESMLKTFAPTYHQMLLLPCKRHVWKWKE